MAKLMPIFDIDMKTARFILDYVKYIIGIIMHEDGKHNDAGNAAKIMNMIKKWLYVN